MGRAHETIKMTESTIGWGIQTCCAAVDFDAARLPREREHLHVSNEHNNTKGLRRDGNETKASDVSLRHKSWIIACVPCWGNSRGTKAELGLVPITLLAFRSPRDSIKRCNYLLLATHTISPSPPSPPPNNCPSTSYFTRVAAGQMCASPRGTSANF